MKPTFSNALYTLFLFLGLQFIQNVLRISTYPGTPEIFEIQDSNVLQTPAEWTTAMSGDQIVPL